MNHKTITKSLALESKYLHGGYLKHLEDKTIKKFKGNCYKDTGFILEIFKPISIIENYISSASCCNIFKVKFKVKTFKPYVGHNLDSNVCSSSCSGILTIAYNIVEIFIPVRHLTNYKYDETRKIYLNDCDEELENTISIKITSVKYEDQKYECIGKLVEEKDSESLSKTFGDSDSVDEKEKEKEDSESDEDSESIGDSDSVGEEEEEEEEEEEKEESCDEL